MANYDRYSEAWSENSARTRTINRWCCFPGCRRYAAATHHAMYQRLTYGGELVPVKGWEQAGVHTFSLCDRHHSRTHPDGAHHPNNWIPGTIPPDYLDARNTTDYYQKLLTGWKTRAKTGKKRRDRPHLAGIAKRSN